MKTICSRRADAAGTHWHLSVQTHIHPVKALRRGTLLLIEGSWKEFSENVRALNPRTFGCVSRSFASKPTGRFVGSLHVIFDARWDHEPVTKAGQKLRGSLSSRVLSRGEGIQGRGEIPADHSRRPVGTAIASNLRRRRGGLRYCCHRQEERGKSMYRIRKTHPSFCPHFLA